MYVWMQIAGLKSALAKEGKTEQLRHSRSGSPERFEVKLGLSTPIYQQGSGHVAIKP